MIQAQISATVIASQIPSRPKMSGSSNTEAIWNTRVRKKDIAAEIPPLFSAVKNADANIFNPVRIKAKENTLKAWQVIVNKSAS